MKWVRLWMAVIGCVAICLASSLHAAPPPHVNPPLIGLDPGSYLPFIYNTETGEVVWTIGEGATENGGKPSPWGAGRRNGVHERLLTEKIGPNASPSERAKWVGGGVRMGTPGAAGGPAPLEVLTPRRGFWSLGMNAPNSQNPPMDGFMPEPQWRPSLQALTDATGRPLVAAPDAVDVPPASHSGRLLPRHLPGVTIADFNELTANLPRPTAPPPPEPPAPAQTPPRNFATVSLGGGTTAITAATAVVVVATDQFGLPGGAVASSASGAALGYYMPPPGVSPGAGALGGATLGPLGFLGGAAGNYLATQAAQAMGVQNDLALVAIGQAGGVGGTVLATSAGAYGLTAMGVTVVPGATSAAAAAGAVALPVAAVAATAAVGFTVGYYISTRTGLDRAGANWYIRNFTNYNQMEQRARLGLDYATGRISCRCNRTRCVSRRYFFGHSCNAAGTTGDLVSTGNASCSIYEGQRYPQSDGYVEYRGCRTVTGVVRNAAAIAE